MLQEDNHILPPKPRAPIGLMVLVIVACIGLYWGHYSALNNGEKTSEWQKKYWAAEHAGRAAEDVRDWAAAARQHEKVIKLLPYGPDSRFGLARAVVMLGDQSRAMEELSQAIECGWTDVKVLNDDAAFANIRDTDSYKALIKRAGEVASEQIALYIPQGVQRPNHAPPLLIVFHGRGQNPHSHIRSWWEAADQLGIVVAAPRGIDRFPGPAAEHSYKWDRGDHSSMIAAYKEVAENAIALAGTHARIDPGRIAVAGYSQGGAVALLLQGEMPERFCGCVAQAPSYASWGVEPWKNAAVRRPVALIVHELDRLRSQGEDALRELKSAGWEVRFDLVSRTDHELPGDNVQRRIDALRFVFRLHTAKQVTAGSPQ